MQLNQVRTFALVATASALLLAVAAGARQRGDANIPSPPAAQNAPATPADKAAPAVTAPAPAPAHQHVSHAAVEKVPEASQNVTGKAMVIVGEVMDPACFLEAGAKSVGPGHLKCAIDCARSGQTLAIYDRDADRIYFIAGELPGKNPNDPVINFVHKKVDVTGAVYHRADAWGIVIYKVALHEDKPEKANKVERSDAAPTGATKLEAVNDKPSAPATGAPAGK